MYQSYRPVPTPGNSRAMPSPPQDGIAAPKRAPNNSRQLRPAASLGGAKMPGMTQHRPAPLPPPRPAIPTQPLPRQQSVAPVPAPQAPAAPAPVPPPITMNDARGSVTDGGDRQPMAAPTTLPMLAPGVREEGDSRTPNPNFGTYAYNIPPMQIAALQPTQQAALQQQAAAPQPPPHLMKPALPRLGGGMASTIGQVYGKTNYAPPLWGR